MSDKGETNSRWEYLYDGIEEPARSDFRHIVEKIFRENEYYRQRPFMYLPVFRIVQRAFFSDKTNTGAFGQLLAMLDGCKGEGMVRDVSAIMKKYKISGKKEKEDGSGHDQ